MLNVAVEDDQGHTFIGTEAEAVVLTEEGLHEAERLFEALFARRPAHAR